MTRILLALLFACIALEARAQTATLNCTFPIAGGTMQCTGPILIPPIIVPPIPIPPIVIPPIPPTGACPMGTAYPDGCPAAPLNTATPRYAGVILKYGAQRPKFNIPGIDYEVGLDPTLPLTDWRTLPNAVVGSGGTQYLRCPGGGAVNLDKVDLTKGGGAFYYTGAGDACTIVNITRSKLGCDTLNPSGPGGVALLQLQKVITGTVTDSDVSLLNCKGIGGGQIINSFGGVQFLRVRYDNSGGPPGNVGGGQFAYGGTQGAPNITVSIKNSVIGDMNNVLPNAMCTGPDLANAGHNNGVQFNKIAAGVTLSVTYNLYYQSINASCIDQGGEFVQSYPNDPSQAPGKITNGEVAFNTIIALRSANGHTTSSNAFNGGGAGCAGNCYFDSNWIDASGMFSQSYGKGSDVGWKQRSGGLFSGSPFVVLGTGASLGFSP